MSKLLTIIFSFLFLASLNAQDVFVRDTAINTQQYEPAGFGGVIAGVDWDADGKPDLYACNSNFIDTRPGELIPRIYKFEWNEGTASWDSVWGATIPGQAQNTWIGFVPADLDKDGKPEIVWMPPNFPDPSDVDPSLVNLNPLRVIVFEVVGDGSDKLGVDDGFGAFLPNASTAIVDNDTTNLRPISPKILDIDSDGTDEIIFADQAAGSSGGGYHFGVLSVDNIPDNGDGSETWTFEANGLNDPNLTRSNKWDLAVVDSTLYLFDNNGGISAVQYAGGTYTAAPLDTVSAGWNGSFKGSVTKDLDNDGTDEIIIGSWYSNKVYVLQIGEDTLYTYEVAELTDAGRLTGAAGGDLDADGNPDFVFGTRGSPASVPNCALFRVEFQGGDISNPASYTWAIIDSLLVPAPGGTGGQLDVVRIANIDGGQADEVIYTQGYSRGVANDTVGAVVILKNISVTPSLIVVDGQKDDFYTTLTGPDDGYLQIRSYAWNDNGVPTNDSDLSAKVWAAWDEQWFYAYFEVMDDVISGSGANAYQDDGMELKIDPEATDSVANTIYAPNLTILGGAGSDSLNIITNAANKQYARHTVEGGYVLEIGMKWSEITTAGETVSVAADSVFGLAINIHDNDQLTGGTRVASVMWAAVMLDAVWNTAEYLGTVKFLPGNKLQFIPTNNMTPWRTNVIPYDGSDYIRVGVEGDQSLLPKQFSLSQNYPNPFNPSTTIRFALPQQTLVQLDVYNLLGEKVMELINSEMPAGYHQTVLNAGSLSSGVYFYRLSAGSFVQTRKLMLLK